ncbi:MAG: DUF488 family protein [Balneolaceae bacterium]
MSHQANIQIKRIKDNPAGKDGYHVLVDRLWSQGVSKDDAQLDEWMKEITPSPELRKWFDQDPEKFEEYIKRHEHELASKYEPVEKLLDLARDQKAMLLYAAKDERNNHAIGLNVNQEKHG